MTSSPTDPALVDVVMPQLGTSVAEGTVIAWAVQVGDTVQNDQVICEISTDKIDSEVPAPAAGTIAEIVVPAGETVEVGSVLTRIASSDAPPRPSVNGVPAPKPTASARYSPVVRRVAAEHDVELSLVSGSGRNGRVTKKDVLAHIAERAAGIPAADDRPLHTESPYQDRSAAAAVTAPPRPDGVTQPLSRMRQTIGAAMRRSLETAATCTTVVECDVSRVERRRRELGLTALPLVARCTIETLREFPDLNATLEDTTFTRYDRVHLGVAVSLGDEGLIVPVIHDAQDLSPEGLGTRIRELAMRARANQLSADDVHGATFTITNPGQFGAILATPVIPLPQVAILDLEAIVKRPIVVTDTAGNDAIAIRPMTNLCMSWDHRAIDGAYAARFLGALRRRLESLA